MASINYARLKISIFDIRIDSYTPRHPHLHLRLGHRVYVTPKKTADYRWSDTFEFDVSFHQHLFWTMQIDVYDTRFLYPHTHLGRAELRLYKLEDPTALGEQWVELREKQHCYANLSSLGLADRELQKHITGSIHMAIQYEIKKDEKASTNDDEMIKNGALVRTTRYSSLPALLPSMMSPTPEKASDEFDAKSVNYIDSKEDSITDHIDNVSQTKERTIEEEIETVQSELFSSREIHYLAKKISGWVLTEGDYQVVQNLLNGLAGFGQGIEVGRVSLTIAYLLLQKYYRSLPNEFSNNIVFTKDDIELPRIVFKYAYAANGWTALYFFGKRNEVFSDVVGSDSNYRAVLEYLQLDPNDMLVCDLDQHRLFRPNFYVALERRLSAVILSIRGTMSIRDTLTDLSFDYIPWNEGIVHSGIMTSAKWFLDNIGKQLCLFAEEYQMSKIILTGHSLGGATASLTTIMLTEELERTNSWPMTFDGQRIDIHCYAYGTPPVLSPNLAKKYTPLIDTFIYGDDVVPRLSYGTMADLQILMVYAAEIGRASYMFATMEGSDFQKNLDKCRSIIQAGTKISNPKLHVPGRIHHIMTIKAPNDRKYTVIDTCGPERFCEMTLRKGMLTHHLPNKYEIAFENAYVTYLLHELEERRIGIAMLPLSMREKLNSATSLLKPDIGSFTTSSDHHLSQPSTSASFSDRSED